MKLFALCVLCLLTRGLAICAESNPQLRLEHVPNGTRFLILGNKPAHPAPLLIMLQGSLESVQKEPIYTEAARILVKRGFISVMIDAPAHGADARPAEANELAAWNSRVGAGEDLLADFLSRAKVLVDWLIKEGYADPHSIAVAGTSRGGFLALHLAAADSRIRCVGAISPVTDLLQLREFSACAHPEAARALEVNTLVAKLIGRPTWISIGNHDERVGTDSAIAFTRQLVAANTAQKKDAPVDLIVHSVPGHRSSVRDHELLADWILKQIVPPASVSAIGLP